MRIRILLLAATALAVSLVAVGCGGGGATTPSGESEVPAPSSETTGATQPQPEPTTSEGGGEVKKGGILRIGAINYIDSFNPFNYIEAAATNAFIMLYPQFVQYGPGREFQGDWATSWETSADGKDWTFHLIPGATWSDGEPMTADDAVWTINTTIEYANGPTAVASAALGHVVSAEAPDESTVVIHYDAPVGNVLAQLETFFILPRHVWEPLVGSDGKGLKTFKPEQSLPLVSGGAYTLKQYEKKGTTVFVPDPNFYGPASNAEAVAYIYYTNSDSMIADLQQGNLDWVDQVPFEAISVVEKDDSLVLTNIPGAETTNITWNSNPRKPKNRELLDPRVKKALSMCVDRDKIIEVVFGGHASKVESIVGHISGELENPNLGPLEYDCAAANAMLDQLGYARGADGIRIAPATTGDGDLPAQEAHPMVYEVITPTSTDFNVGRSFQIVKEGFAELGVTVTQKVGGDTTASYALETGDDCDAEASTGYAGFDIAMWDWVGYVDPDFMLSVVTKPQWCSWSDTGWDVPEYDALYVEQGIAIDPEERQRIVWEMQQMVYDNFLYTQLTNHEDIAAHSKAWDGFYPELNAYSKLYWTAPHLAG